MDDVLSRSRVKNLAKLQSWINFTSLPSVLWGSHFELLIWIRVGNGEIISAPSFSLACSWSEKLFCSSKANRLTSKHQPMQTIRVESLWWQRKNLKEMAVSSLSLHLGTTVSCRGRRLVPWEAVWVVSGGTGHVWGCKALCQSCHSGSPFPAQSLMVSHPS